MTQQDFAAAYSFPLDGFQLQAAAALDAGRSVLLAAPTGSGKTVVAEYAIAQTMASGHKTFYTTPLKALSNQKFGDLVARYGAADVGLLTGDNTINGEAPIVVMTTEVLRNMLYERSTTLEGLRVVVMDEVHYLQDPYRGAVWEEVLIHLPRSVSVVCLSATISNAEEFGDWIETLRGSTEVIIEEKRPVPLEHHYMVGRQLHPMHVVHEGRPTPNPYLVSLEQRELRVTTHQRRSSGSRQQHSRGRPREGHRGVYAPRRDEAVQILDAADMLPAIYFIFSRAGCDRAVRSLYESGLSLTSTAEAERIRTFVDMRAAWMDEDDLWALGFEDFREALCAGIASHHAGMLPVFKETVEELFEQGLVRVVFATETLSLGINMPARTVVIENLWKFQGERHEMLTAGEYTQLTGRAGRRGIDDVGHAVVPFQRDVEFERIAALASTRTYELRSSFRPSYNMTVNLVRNYTREQAHQLLNASFAQFLTDRGVVSIVRSIERDRGQIAELHGLMACDLGNFTTYFGLKERARTIRTEARASSDELRTKGLKEALAGLRTGDVIQLPTGRRRGIVVVVASRDGKPTGLSEDRRERPFRLMPADLDRLPEIVGRIKLPRTGRPHSPKYRREVSDALLALDVAPVKDTLDIHGDRRLEAAEQQAQAVEREAAQHACAACPDRAKHEEYARRALQLENQIERAEGKMRSRTETLGRKFDRVLAVLEELGYVKDFACTDRGAMLTRIYGEGDLLVAEAISDGLFDGLDGPGMAAVASTVVYQSRERTPRLGRMPTQETATAAKGLLRAWGRINRAEQGQQVELCREMDIGFAETIHAWALGGDLEDVLRDAGMTPGDFVRNCKLLLDVLRQIEDVAPGRTAARAARACIDRGVVAYTGI